MSFTKAEFRTLTQQFLDDPNAKRWSATNIDLLIQVTQDTIWAAILDRDPYWVSQLDTITADLTSPGTFSTANGGDLTKRFYKIQSIVRNTREYGQIHRKNVIIEANEVKATDAESDFVYFFFGPVVHLLPYETAPDVEIRYSFYPTIFNGLADGTAVEWPEGHEDALFLGAAALSMAKGGKEDNSAVMGLADRARQRMFEAIERRAPGPMMPFLTSGTTSWGGD